jgi:hypothetical protein
VEFHGAPVVARYRVAFVSEAISKTPLKPRPGPASGSGVRRGEISLRALGRGFKRHQARLQSHRSLPSPKPLRRL